MLKRVLLGVLLNGAALYGLVYLLDDVNYKGGIAFFVIGGIVIGILNTMVKPILRVAAFPMIFMTAGLFMIVINTIILWLTREIIDIISYRDVVFEISGIVTFFVSGFLIGIINWIEHLFFGHSKS
ncbi:MAG: phage holin family protein [Patescibacteria group bacterium]